MGILDDHLNDKCDVRLKGTLNLAIQEMQRSFDDNVRNHEIFGMQEAKNSWGQIRNALADVFLKKTLDMSSINHSIIETPVNSRKNAYTHLTIKTPGAIISNCKTASRLYFPRKAIYRQDNSIINRDFTLFDDPEKLLNDIKKSSQDANLILTYGGYDYNLNHISLGLPAAGEFRWLDNINIKNAVSLIENSEDISHDLKLTLTDEAEEIVRKGMERKNGI